MKEKMHPIYAGLFVIVVGTTHTTGMYGLHPGAILPGRTADWMLCGVYLVGALDGCFGAWGRRGHLRQATENDRLATARSCLGALINTVMYLSLLFLFFLCSHLILFFFLFVSTSG